jgi:hypothetical protein
VWQSVAVRHPFPRFQLPMTPTLPITRMEDATGFGAFRCHIL